MAKPGLSFRDGPPGICRNSTGEQLQSSRSDISRLDWPQLRQHQPSGRPGTWLRTGWRPDLGSRQQDPVLDLRTDCREKLKLQSPVLRYALAM